MKLRSFTAFAFVLAFVVLIVSLSGCEKRDGIINLDNVADVLEGSKVEEIDIGIIVSQSGKDAAPYGWPMFQGFRLAREEINKARIGNVRLTFHVVDDQSTKEGAKEAVEKLVGDELVEGGVPVIAGIAISTYLKEAFPVAQDSGVVALSPVSSAAGLSKEIGDFVFRVGIATNIMMPSGVMATQSALDYTKVAMIYDEMDTYSTSSYDELKKALEENKVEIIATETFSTNDTDFSAQLTKIKDMAPEAVFIAALSQEMTEIIKQGRALGIPDTVHFIVPDLTNAEIQKAGDAAEGAITFTGWSSLSDTPGNQEFVENYQMKYKNPPLAWAAQSYASLYILANAIANAESKDSAGIRDALLQTKDFPTILGNFSFDPDGEAIYDSTVFILIVKDGEFQPFK